jgi:hypothetical protein
MGEHRDEREEEPETAPNPDRDAILRRRRRFMALALGGLTGAATAAGCGDSHEPPGDAMVVDMGAPDAESDAEPVPCLSAPAPDAEPVPCLSAPAPDAEPVPCLEPPPPPGDAGIVDGGAVDAGAADAEPTPCLTI